MDISMVLRGADQLDQLAARMVRAAEMLQPRLEVAVREEGGPAVLDVRAAWLGVEVSSSRGGGEHSGLRARTAAATVSVAIPFGVRVQVNADEVDSRYGNSLVKGLNGMGTWIHPVFGTAATAVQVGQEVFVRTLQARAPAWEARVARVVDQTVRDIEG